MVIVTRIKLENKLKTVTLVFQLIIRTAIKFYYFIGLLIRELIYDNKIPLW